MNEPEVGGMRQEKNESKTSRIGTDEEYLKLKSFCQFYLFISDFF